MSEQAPESSGGGGGVNLGPFGRKLGPLPLWAWMGVGLGVALGAMYFRKNKAASSTTTGTDAGSSSVSSTPNSQIPQFVNQVYTQGAPPVTTSPTQTNTPVPPPTQGNTPAAPIFVDNVAGSLPMPTNLSAKPGTTSATLNWNPISGATLYHVQVENAKGKLIYDNKSVSGNSIIANGLAANTKGYKYRVSAIAPQPGEWTAWGSFNTAK
jgi:hypothetical protein